MKTLSIFSAIFVTATSWLSANSDMRQWTFKSAPGVTAELLKYDEKSGTVVLRKEDKSEINFQQADFTPADQAWLLQWLEYREEMETLVSKLGGTIVRKTGTGKYTTEYSVYHPSGSVPGEELPLMILFHPGGNGHREILRYVEAAEAVKMTVVSCEIFQNSGDNPKVEADYLNRFKELLPQIEANVPHDSKRVYMGGISGGGWRAFHYSAQIDRPWAGIFSNCSWVGDRKYWGLPYPKMRVAMVSGNNDYGRHTIAKDTEVLEKRGCSISLHSFEGGHQVAPPSVMIKAFRWLLGETR